MLKRYDIYIWYKYFEQMTTQVLHIQCNTTGVKLYVSKGMNAL